jgi:hypothetical protein
MDQLDKLQLGMTAEYSQTISDCDIKTFSGISGDKNPCIWMMNMLRTQFSKKE